MSRVQATAEPVGTAAAARRPILVALLLSMGLAAIDTTIVATAVPSMVRDLGGFGSFPWVFSAYLLTQALTIPFYARAADIVGRKPTLLVGIGIFVVGSLLCGVAWSMPALIAFRAVQGIGAGAVQPLTTTIVADLYTLEQRGRVQGYLSTVWGVTAVLGPAVGGAFAQYGTWRWIFLVNLPIGAVAAVLLRRHLHESVTRRAHRMDYAGSLTLAVGLGLIIFGLLQGGAGWAWTSAPELTVVCVGVVALGLFGWAERRAQEPMLPGWVFTRRMLVSGNLSAMCVGALLFGLTSFLPPFAEGVLGVSPVVAGLTVAAVSVSWSVSATSSSATYLRLGFRSTALLGGVLAVAGAVMLTRLDAASSMGAVLAACLVVGLGLGFAFTTVLVAVQSTADWAQRGTVTGANMFARSIGSAVGIAAFGSIVNGTIVHALRDVPGIVSTSAPATLNTVTDVLGGHVHLAAAGTLEAVRHALDLASHRVFLALAGIAVAMVVAQLAMPSRRAAAADQARAAADASEH
ncbi:MAG TPA: MDR family MFS transporter [Mycobacteriales bacterium]|nr:MDR family MFS transporter [Mycobacteriales bacterium]